MHAAFTPRIPLILTLLLLASCARQAEQPREAAPDAALSDAAPTSPAPAQAETLPPSEAFFAGRWASELENCADASWTITTQELRTPGHVVCKFERVTRTTRGAEADAICTAEAPPQPYKLQFSYAQSARALLIEGGPFSDIGLVQCDEGAPPPVSPPAPGTPGGLPDDRTPLSEAPFSPTSAQGAANVVQTYYALVADVRYDDAWRLWTQGGQGSGLSMEAFAQSFEPYESYNANIGKPGRIEGAAGSLYVSVPVVIYGRRKSGEEVHLLGEATLRRANDVPGSTPEQRAWHIYSIDLQPTAGNAR